jgi:hypothetical protein
LRYSAGAQFFQELEECLEMRGWHVAELALVKLVNGLVERFEKIQALRSDAG